MKRRTLIRASQVLVAILVGIFGAPANPRLALAQQSEAAKAASPADEETKNNFRIAGDCSRLDLIKDADGGNLRAELTPLPRAKVTLYVVRGTPGVLEEVGTTEADERGHYEFTNLAPPRYDSRIERRWYGMVARAEGLPAAIWPLFEGTNPADADVNFAAKSATLSGRLTDADGNPVAGATVSQYGIHGLPVPGVQSAITNKIGRFRIEEVPDFDRGGPSDGVQFRITHPDHPATSVSVPALPAETVFRFTRGCTVTGTVRDKVAGQPAAGALVRAQENKNTQNDAQVLTDDQGRYRLVLPEGRYNILVEALNRAGAASTGHDCRTGETTEIPPLELTEGGWIEGRVVNTRTNQPVVENQRGGRITIGLIGPGSPARKRLISPEAVATVDAEGRFRLRATAGDNFPYLVNERGMRMAWDTQQQPAVVVAEGETTHYDMLIEPELTPEEKMKAARAVLATLPADQPARVAAILEEFRKLNHTVDECEIWCSLMRELVTIGADAVPQIGAELDATNEQRMIRRLGFALRAINDPRAVPALIRAIPKTLQPPLSDYGLIVADADLTAFMQKHQINPVVGGQYFDFGRPVREVFSALHTLTGKKFGDDTLFGMMRGKNTIALAEQQKRYHRQAERWQAWWEEHWQEKTTDEAYAKVNLPPAEEIAIPPVIALGPSATTDGGTRGATLSPPGESGGTFLDLDTGLDPKWPLHIPENEAADHEREIALWAAQNGVDLMCVIYRAPDGKETYALRAFNMRLWEISERDAEEIDELIKEGKLPERKPAGELLLHVDEATGRYVPEANAAFLYATREGGTGVIHITDRITEKRDITGMVFAPKGVGFHKGVKFNQRDIIP